MCISGKHEIAVNLVMNFSSDVCINMCVMRKSSWRNFSKRVRPVFIESRKRVSITAVMFPRRMVHWIYLPIEDYLSTVVINSHITIAALLFRFALKIQKMICQITQLKQILIDDYLKKNRAIYYNSACIISKKK